MELTGKLESALNATNSNLNAVNAPGGSAANVPNKPTPKDDTAAVERMISNAHQAVDKMALVATQAAQTLDVQRKQLKETQTKIIENARSYVKDHPAASIGIALTAGFLIRHLLRLR